MTRHWQDGAPIAHQQEVIATRSLADGWQPHYLCQSSERGGGLSLGQLRGLQARLEGVDLPGPKPIDWEQWLGWAETDPKAASCASRFLNTVGNCVATEGRVRWNGQSWRPARRVSPREILRAADDGHSMQWEIDRTTVEKKLCELVAPRPTNQLIECLETAWHSAVEQASQCLIAQARRKLVDWVCRFAERALCERGVGESVVAVAHDRQHLTAIAVNAKGVCCAERTIETDKPDDAVEALNELKQMVGAQSVIGRVETLATMLPVLTKVAAVDEQFAWIAVGGCGAAWWAKQLDAVTNFGQWSKLGREALFMAHTYQSPLETLAELPADEFAPSDLHRWMGVADWRRVEQRVDDVIHCQGLDLYRSGPRAVARLCGVSPLHAHRGRPPEGGWASLEQFRDALGLSEKQWTQTLPFVRLGIAENAAPPTALCPRRRAVLAWEQLEVGQRCHGLVLRAATFGAFLDIGGPCEAMLHISECSRRFVSDPWECLAPGEVVEVEVSQLDNEKHRIAVRMVQGAKPNAKNEKARKEKTRKEKAKKATESRDGTPPTSRRDAKRRGKSSERTRKRKPKTYQPPSSTKPPPEPISPEMADGKAPMRSFSDLVQFYDQKRTDEDSSS